MVCSCVFLPTSLQSESLISCLGNLSFYLSASHRFWRRIKSGNAGYMRGWGINADYFNDAKKKKLVNSRGRVLRIEEFRMLILAFAYKKVLYDWYMKTN